MDKQHNKDYEQKQLQNQVADILNAGECYTSWKLYHKLTGTLISMGVKFEVESIVDDSIQLCQVTTKVDQIEIASPLSEGSNYVPLTGRGYSTID
jgi:hypothetical protein